jgi:hypothetical protein
MDAPATLEWIAPDAPDGPDASQARALASWGRAHGVKLVTPRDERPPALPVDESVAEDVEKLLEHARDAISARDGEAVDRALATAEAALRAHPELRQGSWLMAEVERVKATRWRRVPPVDVTAAERAWQRAEALDGGRVTGVGEEPARTSAAAATLTLDLTPDPTSDPAPERAPGAQAWLDGEPVHGGVAPTRAGPHALVVTWNDTPVWAAWIDVPAGSSSLRVVAPAPPPCSADDLGRARLHRASRAPLDAHGVDASAVRCTQWVAAAPAAQPDAVRIAMCEAHACGPLVEWRWRAPSPAAWAWTPPPDRTTATAATGGGWPSWATWGLVGAGAVIATGVVVLATGVLQPAPTETRFVSGGIKAQ